MDRAPNFRPVRRGKVVHVLRWTTFLETFPVGPNRSIEFWTEISGNFGWMDRAPGLTSRRSPDLLLRDSTKPRHIGITQITVWLGHFRVPKTLTFKMRPSAQPFPSVEMSLFTWESEEVEQQFTKNHGANYQAQWKIISISNAEHLPRFDTEAQPCSQGSLLPAHRESWEWGWQKLGGTRKNGLQNGGHLKGVPFFVSLPATKTLIDEK